MFVPLPLTPEQTTEYNNVATTPPTAPLGDIINELAALIPGAGNTVVADTFDCAVGVAVNDAVYLSAPNTVAKASAVAGGGQTPPAMGFVASKPTAITAVVCSAGSTLTTAFAGLTPDAQYWLSTTVVGGITAVAPSTSGQALQPVGKAVTATKFLVEIGESILL